jgi:hypothetical protein
MIAPAAHPSLAYARAHRLRVVDELKRTLFRGIAASIRFLCAMGGRDASTIRREKTMNQTSSGRWIRRGRTGR